jgi:hypothetical protein
MALSEADAQGQWHFRGGKGRRRTGTGDLFQRTYQIDQQPAQTVAQVMQEARTTETQLKQKMGESVEELRSPALRRGMPMPSLCRRLPVRSSEIAGLN